MSDLISESGHPHPPKDTPGPVSGENQHAAEGNLVTEIPRLEIPTIRIGDTNHEIPQPDRPNQFNSPNSIFTHPPERPDEFNYPRTSPDPVIQSKWAMYDEEHDQWQRQAPIREALKAQKEKEAAEARERGFTPPPFSSPKAEAAITSLTSRPASPNTDETKELNKASTSDSADTKGNTQKSLFERLLGIRISRRDAIKSAAIATGGAAAGHQLRNNDDSKVDSQTPDNSANSAEATPVSDDVASSTTPEAKNTPPTLKEQFANHELHLSLEGWKLKGNTKDLETIVRQCKANNEKKRYSITYEKANTYLKVEVAVDPDGYYFSEGVTTNNLPGTPKDQIDSYQLTFFPTNTNLNVFFSESTENLTTGSFQQEEPIVITPDNYATNISQYEKVTDMGETVEVISEVPVDDLTKIGSYTAEFAMHGSSIREIRMAPDASTNRWSIEGLPDTGVLIDSHKFDPVGAEFFNQGVIELGKQALHDIYWKADKIAPEALSKFKEKQAELDTRLKNAMITSGANGADNGAMPTADYFSAFRTYKEALNYDPTILQKYDSAEEFFVDVGITLKEGLTRFKGYIEEQEKEGVMTTGVKDAINEVASLYINILFKLNGDNLQKIRHMTNNHDWEDFKNLIDYERWAGEHTLSFPKDQ